MAKVPSELFGLSVMHIAAACQVSLKTAGRWKDGTTCPPKSALWILTGDLGCFDAKWKGWLLRHGELVSPEGWCITMADVRATPLQRSQIAIYQAENRRLKDEIKGMGYSEDQPLPGSESAILAEAMRVLAG